MTERLLLLAVATAVALVAVRLLERMRPSATVDAPSGVTVVTGPDCRLCETVLSLLDARGIRYRSTPASSSPWPGVRSVPTVLVADGGGSVLLRRSGRSAVTDVDEIVATVLRLEAAS